MKRLSTIIIAGLVIVLAGGVLFLASWEIPAPSAQIERAIPDDRFPR